MQRSILLVLVGFSALALPARAQTVLFSDGFENGLANWSTTGLWHLVDSADTCASQVAPFPEGNHCVYYGTSGCNYDIGANAGELTLLTPIALPAGGPRASLHCWTRHQTEVCYFNQYDNFDIQVSANGGQSWSFVGRRCDMDFPTPEDWQQRSADLSAWLGQSILLRFRFDTVDPYFNQQLGAFVDSVEVWTETGQAFCYTGCPCNSPTPAYTDLSIGYAGFSGCTHSQGIQAELAGSGTPSVSNDTLVLTASRLRMPSVVMVLQSTGYGSGAFNGDGRYCLSGSSVRLAVQLAPAGSASIPAAGASPLSVQGSIPPAGATRYYQAVYRDPTSWCTAAGLNQTNAYIITWTP